MAVVGAYIRVEIESAEAVREQLAGMDGISTFNLGDAGKVGLVIEAPDLDKAHAKLSKEVQGLEGVLGAWPIYANFETDEEEPDGASGG